LVACSANSRQHMDSGMIPRSTLVLKGLCEEFTMRHQTTPVENHLARAARPFLRGFGRH
jgi:hypothetical protein